MKKLGLLLSLLGMCIFCSGCDDQPVNTQMSVAQTEGAEAYVQDAQGFEDEVLVGRVVPLTGVLRSFGEGTPDIEQDALDAINASGGVIIDGKRCCLRMVCRDSGSTIDGARDAAEQLIDEGIDVMVVSHTADTVMPVSAVCETRDILCVSVDAPASAWAMGGPYQNAWHAFFDNERELLCFLDAWERVDTNKKIGLMTANDSEGIEISTFVHDFAAAKGYTVIDVGAYYLGEQNYTEYIEAFAAEQCDIIMGVMVNADFSRFWTQVKASDYRPKMCTIAKACLFERDIHELKDMGDGLITEVWWSGAFPFVSSITGEDSRSLEQRYLSRCQGDLRVAPPTVGYKYANIEIMYDILKRAGTLDADVLNRCARETDLDTIVGHVSYSDNQVSYMSCVAGQWILGDDGCYRQEIVGNYLLPGVAITADIELLE